mgnify:CR=1 FL=1
MLAAALSGNTLSVTGTADGKNVTWMEKVSDEQYQGK